MNKTKECPIDAERLMASWKEINDLWMKVTVDVERICAEIGSVAEDVLFDSIAECQLALLDVASLAAYLHGEMGVLIGDEIPKGFPDYPPDYGDKSDEEPEQ